MKTILFIQNNQVQVAEIQKNNKNFATYNLAAGTILNGVILRPDALRETLAKLSPKPKRVTLVIDSSNITAKKLTLPKVSPAKLHQIVKEEFGLFQTDHAYQYDANVLSGATPMTVMGYAVGQELIGAYMQVCKDCGIVVNRDKTSAKLKRAKGVTVKALAVLVVLAIMVVHGATVFLSYGAAKLENNHLEEAVNGAEAQTALENFATLEAENTHMLRGLLLMNQP